MYTFDATHRLTKLPALGGEASFCEGEGTCADGIMLEHCKFYGGDGDPSTKTLHTSLQRKLLEANDAMNINVHSALIGLRRESCVMTVEERILSSLSRLRRGSYERRLDEREALTTNVLSSLGGVCDPSIKQSRFQQARGLGTTASWKTAPWGWDALLWATVVLDFGTHTGATRLSSRVARQTHESVSVPAIATRASIA